VNLSASLVAEVPPGVVTVTSTVLFSPPAGLTAVIWVGLSILKLLAGFLPKETPVTPIKPEPWIVTEVPPSGDPLVGSMLDTTGK
jgi:hypothetical protein